MVKQKIEPSKQRDPNMYPKTEESTIEKMKTIKTNGNKYDVDKRWEEVQNTLISSSRENAWTLKKAKQERMTYEILYLMEERRR